MPELDAERRERLAEALRGHREDATYPNTCLCETEAGVNVPEEHYREHIAAILAPLIAGWLADDTAVCTTCQHRGGDDQPAQHPGCAAALGRIRAAALRDAAREAWERGDIGKDGGTEAWVWLDWRADRIGGTAAAGTRENGEGAHQGTPDAPAPGGSSTDGIPGPQIGAQRFEGER